MSWPTDGKPRYKIAVTRGHTPNNGTQHTPANTGGTSIAILDRAYCHRVVKVWATERAHVPYGVIEDRAYALLIELNGKEPRP